MLSILSSLVHIYKREEKVITICERGLANALKILAEVEAEISSSENFFKRLKSTSLSKIPIVGKKFGGPESLMILLKLLYSYLKDQVFYIDENLHKIRWVITRQHKWIIVLTQRIEREDVVGNISETRYFKDIEMLHQEELFLVNEITEKSKAKRDKIFKVLNQINIKLNQHQAVLKVQGILIALPTPTMFAVTGGLFLGPQVATLFFTIGIFVSYSPAIAIVGVLGLKCLSKKSQ
mgnify:CR=1 FL=1|jgi:hypothetical protein|tara:strand:- start:203 stop:910 length:708 start_codon:yes stop_codon:yes gene_type:complete